MKNIKNFHGYVANILGISREEIEQMKLLEIKERLLEYNLDWDTLRKQFEAQSTLYNVSWPEGFEFEEMTAIFKKIEKYKHALIETNVFHTNINGKKIRVSLKEKNIEVVEI